MLTLQTLDSLLAPVREDDPCGADLEYDADFIALESAALSKPEQQFGDTVIAAVEPDWPQVAEQAHRLLERTKDLRPAVLLLRASTHTQGLTGFDLGMQLLNGLLSRYWNDIHPKLDADDDNDPTMRLNTLAPLTDESLLLRDFYDAIVGSLSGVGTLRVCDIAVARNVLTPTGGDAAFSPAQVQGALESLFAQRNEISTVLQNASVQSEQLQKLINEQAGRSDLVDLSRLRKLCHALKQAALAASGSATQVQEGEESDTETASDHATEGSTLRGDIRSRQDALRMLDKVTEYLEQAEPGNPAPLLIRRAKQLIGVSFIEIIENLAPGAMDSIQAVTGRRDN